MKINLYMSTSISLTVGKYTLTLEAGGTFWRLFKKINKERGIAVFQCGPIFISLTDDEKQERWLESLMNCDIGDRNVDDKDGN